MPAKERELYESVFPILMEMEEKKIHNFAHDFYAKQITHTIHDLFADRKNA